ncbi:MAG: cytochrome bc complex cytochrome b subunit [Armatimonadota bacterium]
MEERPTRRERVVRWLLERTRLEDFVRVVSAAFLYEALDARLSFREALGKALKKPVPGHAIKSTWCLGGTALFVFGLQVVTGILLSIYYKPSPDAAYESVRHITADMRYGWIIRQLHAWGAHVMVILVILHMLKVFFNKAYRPPRELTWVSGVLLLFLTLTFCFTGYLLPWNQLAYWASKVGTDMASTVPVVGEYILYVLRGGPNVTGLTLSRFFTVHALVLPWVVSALLVAHFALVRRLGISEAL